MATSAMAFGAAGASAADSTTITCFGSGVKDIAGVEVKLEDAGAEQGTNLPCGYWFSPDYFEHFHPRDEGTVATAWSFSPGLNSVIFRILHNADGIDEEYTIIAKDAGGNRVGSPIVYRNKDEDGRRVDFPRTVTRLEAWHEGGAGDLALFNFSVPSNELRVDLNGDGNVTSDVGGIDCGVDSSDCKADFADLDPSIVVTLTATPDVGQTFNGWTGCDSTSGSTCTVTMSKAQDITASFSGESSGYLDVEVVGDGKVTSTPSGIDVGLGATEGETSFVIPTSVTLKAAPRAGSKFVRWTGDRCSGSNPTCVVTVDDCLSIRAVFGKASIKLTGASTRPRHPKGTSRLPVAFGASAAGHARLTLAKCDGGKCSKLLIDRTILAGKGANRMTLRTRALSPGRYRFAVGNSAGSSATHFTVTAPPSKPRYTG